MRALAKSPDPITGVARDLLGHSLDVAYAGRFLMQRPVLRARLGAALGQPLSDVHINHLTFFIGGHDFGKTLELFYQRISQGGVHIPWKNGHVPEMLAAIMLRPEIHEAIGLQVIQDWFEDRPSLTSVVRASICHHGAPVSTKDINEAKKHVASNVTPAQLADLKELRDALMDRFPPGEAAPLRITSEFEHLFAGLVMLADWIGSSLPQEGPQDRPEVVRQLIDEKICWDGWHSGAPFDAILEGKTPLGAQNAIAQLSLEDRLVTVEAPTGTGKTETALMWANRLAAEGLVDGMYFAVPLRSAAVELHKRIEELMRIHPKLHHKIIRAVPGIGLPDGWQKEDSWSLGSSKKSLSAPIAVGTVDQAMLSILANKHAWMRYVGLSRHLLVIDEVHASDAYMTQIIARLIEQHLALGGYVMTMSATLGECARAQIEGRKALTVAEALAEPYPVVRGSASGNISIPAPDRKYRIELTRAPFEVARDKVTEGNSVVWIHSTVNAAIATYRRAVAEGIPAILHHSRYADADRKTLDRRILELIGKNGSRESILICATQTIEQSLDIDADVLISEPCPGDVLLQRLGRNGRHRPDWVPTAYFVDPGDMDAVIPQLLRLANGQACRLPEGFDWGYVYPALSVARTVDFLRQHPELRILEHSRALVEHATNWEAMESYAEERGAAWLRLWSSVEGQAAAGRQMANLNLIDWSDSYGNAQVDYRAPSRLGELPVTVQLERPFESPLGNGPIETLAIPLSWLRGVEPREDLVAEALQENEYVRIRLNSNEFLYGEEGLSRVAAR